MAGKREKKKKGGAGFIILLLLVVFALIYIIASKVYSDYKNYDVALDPSDTASVAVTIPSGSTTTSIAQILYDNGIIPDVKKFKMKSRLNGLDGTFQAGDYQFSPSMTTSEIMELLQSGRKAEVSFTIPEGYTVKDTAEKLAEEGLIASPEEFYAACEEDWESVFWFLNGVTNEADPSGAVSAKANRLEGFLYPETYRVPVGAAAHDIVERMLSQFDTVFTPLWQEAGGTDGGTVNGLTVHEMVTLASLVERESKAATDRDKIASVIYNRLDMGMKLQIDATVLYALGEWKDRVYYSDLEVDSPYNTYAYAGLPVGPICSSGAASIEGALYPASTEYIYYVLKGDGSGEHNFAEDAATFEQYKQEYLNSL
ncbi:MAG: endolytic transglycosylase MltG [Firmicutes bacterium]|nr:endolytic transglycosylase MltG [Bacillota bacterium]